MKLNPISAQAVWFAVSSVLLRQLRERRKRLTSFIRNSAYDAVIATHAVNLMQLQFLKP